MAHPPDTVLGSSLSDKTEEVVVLASGGNVKSVLSIASMSNTAPTSSSTRIESLVRSLFFLISDALIVCQQLEKIERERWMRSKSIRVDVACSLPVYLVGQSHTTFLIHGTYKGCFL